MNEKLPWRFVEYGKALLGVSASDYTELAYSPGMAGQTREYTKSTIFPARTRFEATLGQVSVAMLPGPGNNLLFLHLQSRRENEIPHKDRELETKAVAMRPFTQVRYNLLARDTVQHLFEETFPYEGLVRLAPAEVKSPVPPYLPDYTSSGVLAKEPLLELDTPAPSDWLWKRVQPQLELVAIIAEAIFISHNKGGSRHVRVRCPATDETGGKWGFWDRLGLVEAVQRLVYPVIGFMTFALDYVVAPLTPVHLQLYRPGEEIPVERGIQPLLVDLTGDSLLNPAHYGRPALNTFNGVFNADNKWETANRLFFFSLAGHIWNRHSFNRFKDALPLATGKTVERLKAICNAGDLLPAEDLADLAVTYWNTLLDAGLLNEEWKSISHTYEAYCILEKVADRVEFTTWLDCFLTSSLMAEQRLPLLLLALASVQTDEATLKEGAKQLQSALERNTRLIEAIFGKLKEAVPTLSPELSRALLTLVDPVPPERLRVGGYWLGIDGESAVKWLERLGGQGRLLAGNKGAWLYELFKRLLPPWPEKKTTGDARFIQYMLRESAASPEGFSFDKEYKFWLAEVEKIDGTAIPALTCLAGMPGTAQSIRQSTRTVFGNEALFAHAAAFILEKNALLLTDLNDLIPIILAVTHGGRLADIAVIVMAKNVLPMNIASQLLAAANSKPQAIEALRALANVPAWQSHLEARKLPAEELETWLKAVNPGDHAAYRQGERHNLYDLVSKRLEHAQPQKLKAEEAIIWLELIWQALCFLPLLPTNGYDILIEYEALITRARGLAQGLKVPLPASLQFLVYGPAADDGDDEVRSISSYSQAIEKGKGNLALLYPVIKHTLNQPEPSTLPVSDVQWLLEQEFSDIDQARRLLVIARDKRRLPHNIWASLIASWPQSTALLNYLLNNGTWRDYLKEAILAIAAATWLAKLPGDDSIIIARLYMLAASALKRDEAGRGQLLWEMVQAIPLLPWEATKQQNELSRHLSLASSWATHQQLPQELVALIRVNPERENLKPVVAETKDPEGLFVLFINNWLQKNPGKHLESDNLKELIRLAKGHPERLEQAIRQNPLDFVKQILSDDELLTIVFSHSTWPDHFRADAQRFNELAIYFPKPVKDKRRAKRVHQLAQLASAEEKPDEGFVRDVICNVVPYLPVNERQEAFHWWVNLLGEPTPSDAHTLAARLKPDGDGSLFAATYGSQQLDNYLLFFLAIHYVVERLKESPDKSDVKKYHDISAKDPFGKLSLKGKRGSGRSDGRRLPGWLLVVPLIILIGIVAFYLAQNRGEPTPTQSLSVNLTTPPTQAFETMTPSPTTTATHTSTSTPSITPTPVPTATPTPPAVTVINWSGRGDILFTRLDEANLNIAPLFFLGAAGEPQPIFGEDRYLVHPYLASSRQLIVGAVEPANPNALISPGDQRLFLRGNFDPTGNPVAVSLETFTPWLSHEWIRDFGPSRYVTLCERIDLCLLYPLNGIIIKRFYFMSEMLTLEQRENPQEAGALLSQSSITALDAGEEPTGGEPSRIIFSATNNQGVNGNNIYQADLFDLESGATVSVTLLATLPVGRIRDLRTTAEYGIVVLLEQDTGGYAIYTVNQEGRPELIISLLPLFIEAFQISWSPDGSAIAFTAVTSEAISGPDDMGYRCDRGCLFLLNLIAREIQLVVEAGNGVRDFWWTGT